tara:strand:- start:5504 stop:5740 length:237 start_codon:yes stop_codon:yes gene_type:complete
MEEHQQQLCKMLDINPTSSWAEVYEAIGKLKERAEKPTEIKYFPSTTTMPLTIPAMPPNPNLHYHGTMPCYQSPCVWC